MNIFIYEYILHVEYVYIRTFQRKLWKKILKESHDSFLVMTLTPVSETECWTLRCGRTPGWAGQGPWVPLGTWPKLLCSGRWEGPGDVQVSLATQTHPGFDSGALRRGSRAPCWAGDRAKPSKYRKSSPLIARTTQDDERQVSIKDPSLSVLHWQNTSTWLVFSA